MSSFNSNSSILVPNFYISTIDKSFTKQLKTWFYGYDETISIDNQTSIEIDVTLVDYGDKSKQQTIVLSGYKSTLLLPDNQNFPYFLISFYTTINTNKYLLGEIWIRSGEIDTIIITDSIHQGSRPLRRSNLTSLVT